MQFLKKIAPWALLFLVRTKNPQSLSESGIPWISEKYQGKLVWGVVESQGTWFRLALCIPYVQRVSLTFIRQVPSLHAV